MQSTDTGINQENLTDEQLIEKYREFINNVTQHSAVIDKFELINNKITKTETEIMATVNQSLTFDKAYTEVYDDYYQKIRLFLFTNGYKSTYDLEENDIWLLGWLLNSKEQFEVWDARPNDMIISPSRSNVLNKTDFLIIQDYLDDLIQQTLRRAVLNQKDAGEFGFHIMRGLRFNISDKVNVTNCTDGRLFCPCLPNVRYAKTEYCDKNNNSLKLILGKEGFKSASEAKAAHRAEAAKPSSTSSPSSNSSVKTITLPTSLTSTLTSKGQGALNTAKDSLSTLKSKFKKPKSLQKTYSVPALTPFTAMLSFEKNYDQEIDIQSFLKAFKVIMEEYVRDVLLKDEPKDDENGNS